MKIQTVCLLLVLLCAIEFSEALTFHEKHVVEGMTKDKCTEAMVNINNVQKKCEYTNVFILGDDAFFAAVCANNGDQKSAERIEVVTCTFKKGGKFPKCEYTGNTLKTKIKLSCEGNQPVKYFGPVA